MNPDDTSTAVDVTRVIALLNQFAHLADQAEVSEIGTVLADDVEWRMPETTWHGRADVLLGLGSMRELGYAGPASGNRHVVTNHQVRVDGDRAWARSYFQLVSGGARPRIIAVGAYSDELRREPGGGWVLTRREVTL